TAFFLLCYIVMTTRTVPAHQFVRIACWVLVFCAIYVVAEGIATRIDEDFRGIFDGVLGLISGVVLALLVGRLESKLIDSPRWIVASLYAYAVLQLAYPVLGGMNHLARLIVLSIALLLKVLLFWHVRELIVSGRLTYYMFEFRRLYDTAALD